VRLASIRLFDLILGSGALLITLPAALLVALVIRVFDGGPVLFLQERIGLGGNSFELLKFRTIKAVTPAASPSRLGHILRRFHIDELPQLVNVVRGEMSLVGPRPEIPSLVKLFETEIPDYQMRHAVRPGITGWAQVKTGDGVSVEETRVKLSFDLEYVRRRSLWMDLLILVRTFRVVLFGVGES
jgi:lipopolysaccharide/colanic/teichoic acid biosynthesis glycosyltransferase